MLQQWLPWCLGSIYAVPTSHRSLHLYHLIHFQEWHQRADLYTLLALRGWWLVHHRGIFIATNTGDFLSWWHSPLDVHHFPIFLRHTWHSFLSIGLFSRRITQQYWRVRYEFGWWDDRCASLVFTWHLELGKSKGRLYHTHSTLYRWYSRANTTRTQHFLDLWLVSSRWLSQSSEQKATKPQTYQGRRCYCRRETYWCLE